MGCAAPGMASAAPIGGTTQTVIATRLGARAGSVELRIPSCARLYFRVS